MVGAVEDTVASAGDAYWHQRAAIARDADRIRTLVREVGRPSDLWPYQWAQLMSFALAMRPDLILELGRGYGNSTCAFTEAAALLGGDATRVVSICRSRSWDQRTRSAIAPFVTRDWTARLTILRGDIRRWDPAPYVRDAQRVLVFWDAHSFDVAEWVFGRLAPLLEGRDHAILVHDISDRRFQDPARDAYDGPMWKGRDDGAHLRIGPIDTGFEEAVALLDFTARNGIALRSAEEEIRAHFDAQPEQADEMRAALGDLFALEAHWSWLRVRRTDGRALTYPRLDAPARPGLVARLRGAAKLILRGEL